MKKKPDKDSYYKCIKVPLKHIAKYDTVIEKINETVVKANKIVIYALQFIKLYCINEYNENKTLPTIDENFINATMKTLCKESSQGRPPSKKTKELKDKLKLFYDEHFKELMTDNDLDYLHMNTILDYISTDILTMYENNIKQHYIEYLERFVNVFWKKTKKIDKINEEKDLSKNQKDIKIKEFITELRKVKLDLLNIEDKELKSNEKYHKWIKKNKKIALPNKDKYMKDSLYYDLQCNPQDYFICMFQMMEMCENQDETIYNLFPMRNDIIQKHIKIDTTSIVHLLLEKNKGFFLTKGNLKKNEDKLWKFFFRTERQCFSKKNYSFHHMINTDGISCSIMLIRNDMIGRRIPTTKKQNNEKYIDELDNKDYDRLKDKKIVAYDPNLSDLLYCVDGTEKDRNQFRYTQDKRRKETKQKKYRDIIHKLRKKKIEKKKTVVDLETEISKYNRKTLDIKKFKKYLKKKNETNEKLFEFYKQDIFRKLKLNGYINRIQSEQLMISRFTEKFGSPEDVVIVGGDYEQKQHMKYKEPVKGKGFRELFRKNGFELYLGDEHKTSCRCSVCEGECETFRTCENPRPWKDGTITRHGLVRCKTCAVLWNRDENSSCNIFKIAENAINKKTRPTYLCRVKEKLVSPVTSAVAQPKITRV